MKNITLTTEYLKGFVSGEELEALSARVKAVHNALHRRECAGKEYTGWLDLPSAQPAALLRDIEDTARQIRKNSDIFIVLGIGGSYLGARAAIEFLKPFFCGGGKKEPCRVCFAGHNLSNDYLRDLFVLLKGRRVSVNVISKSGTTTETAVVFRLVRRLLERRFGKTGAKSRIICTTDKTSGALRRFADEQGYKTFVIPEDIGGRFSVLTPVGLLPVAAAGIDIRRLISGAADFERKCRVPELRANAAYRYAAIRYILYKKGKSIELFSAFHPALSYLGEWWKQLFGESEGKNNRGIFPASCVFTTDLHSLGQWIQEGPRNVFETFLYVNKPLAETLLPRVANDFDGLNYLAGKDISFINRKAYEGTAQAHYEGGVPNMTLEIPERSAYHLGQLFYFFEKAAAVSGLLLGVNPFDQPGVEAYKKKMFTLLGKPSCSLKKRRL